MRWFLISEEDTQFIRAALEMPEHDDNDFNCPYDPYSNTGCAACAGRKARGEAIHILDTGLHVTDAVPADFQG